MNLRFMSQLVYYNEILLLTTINKILFYPISLPKEAKRIVYFQRKYLNEATFKNGKRQG